MAAPGNYLSPVSSKTTATLIAAGIGAVAGAVIAARANFFVALMPADEWRVAPGAIIYILFGVYWDIAAKRSSVFVRSESRASALLHQLLIALSALLIVFPLPGLLHRLMPASNLFTALGIAIEGLGIALAIWARRALGNNWSREVGIKEGHRLVRLGPYARVRHPIYAGALLIYVGLAVAAGRVHALLGLALACAAYWRKIAMEERILRQAYGATFNDYLRNSRLLIPYLL